MRDIKEVLAEIKETRLRFAEANRHKALVCDERKAVPLFPIASFTRGSKCPHRGHIRAGSRFVCMVCLEFGGDFDPVFQAYPWYLPWNRREPMPAFELDRPSIPTHRHKGDVAGRVRDCASWLYRNCGAKKGKTVSLERACELAGVCPKNIRERHPGVVEYVEWLAGRNRLDREVLKRYVESNNPASTEEAKKNWYKPVRPLIEITPMGEYREHGVRVGLSKGQENHGLFDAPSHRRKEAHRGAFDKDRDDYDDRQSSMERPDVASSHKRWTPADTFRNGRSWEPKRKSRRRKSES